MQMRERDGHRIDDQDEVEKGNLTAERLDLRTHELGVSFRNRQRFSQSGYCNHSCPLTFAPHTQLGISAGAGRTLSAVDASFSS
jgi:hypothetical protein